MADFLSNLLLRSGLAAASTPAAIFQPRLPALFEASGGVEGIPVPPPAPTQIAALPPAVESSVSLPGTLLPVTPLAAPAQTMAHTAADDPTRPAPLLPGTPVPITIPAQPVSPLTRLGKRRREPPQRAPLADRLATLPRIQAASDELLSDTPQAGEAATASIRPTSPRSRPAPTTRRKPARADTPPIEVSGVTHPAESLASLPRLVESRLVRPVDPLPVKAVREFAGSPTPIPVASRPSASQAALPEANEPAVQIHIGRIEVRAVTPPASPPPSRPVPAEPKLSLDEYLHQREGKR